MKKTTIVIILTAVFFILMGVAYSTWSDQIVTLISAGSGETDLQVIAAEVIGTNTRAIIGNNLVSCGVKVRDLEPYGTTTINLTVQNTGTVPVDLDDVVIKKIKNYTPNQGRRIYIRARVYSSAATELNVERNIPGWDSVNGSSASGGIMMLSAGETCTVQARVFFYATNWNRPPEDFNFRIRLFYSRFNDD